MTYKLTEDSGRIVGGASFESFWLFVRFGINAQTKLLKLQTAGNYFAFYGSASSAHRRLDLPEFGSESGQAQTKNYELSGNELSLGLNSLSLLESRCVDMSNESSQLHLFQFLATPDQGPDTWLNDGGWNASYPNRAANSGSTDPFVPHIISFGDCSERDCFWTLSRDTQLGTTRFGVTLPFLRGSILSNILRNANKSCPALSLRVKEDTWSAFDSTPLPGDPTGFVMVSSGVFRQLSLSAEIEQWHQRTAAAPAPSEILDQLSIVAERRWRSETHREQQLERTLHTVHINNDNAVVQEDSRHPVETLYVDMKLHHAVPRLIQYR
jgi:hypothetical protein